MAWSRRVERRFNADFSDLESIWVVCASHCDGACMEGVYELKPVSPTACSASVKWVHCGETWLTRLSAMYFSIGGRIVAWDRDTLFDQMGCVHFDLVG